MLTTLLLTALAVGPADQPPAASHTEANPVYKFLIDEGVFEGEAPGRLPKPTMADGASAAEQLDVLNTIGAPRHDFKSLTRNSIVAPHLVDIHTVESGDSERPLQSIEFWFIAHADMRTMSDKAFLDSLLTAEDSEGKALNEAELKQRGIALSDADRESYGQIIFPLLKKVQLHATGHSYWSRTKDSLLTASVIDPRFRDDKSYPNQWRPLDREGKPGKAQPYTGAGLYMKITQLQAPAGAVFVECHIRGVEPKGWFNGRNLLRSKLPPAIQSQVRTARQQMIRNQKQNQGARGK